MERFLENAMYASRWLLAPVYFGLSLALVALALKFFQEIIHVLPNIFSMAESDLILVLLSLVDMTLVGGLLVMVMFSGYENFVSQLDISENKEKLNWLGKMDATSLKNKVAASIVAISSIHLLRVFMDAKNVPDNKLMWYVSPFTRVSDGGSATYSGIAPCHQCFTIFQATATNIGFLAAIRYRCHLRLDAWRRLFLFGIFTSVILRGRVF